MLITVPEMNMIGLTVYDNLEAVHYLPVQSHPDLSQVLLPNKNPPPKNDEGLKLKNEPHKL